MKTTGFILGTIWTPLLMIFFSVLPALVLTKAWRTDYQLVVLDQTEDAALYESAERHMAADYKAAGRLLMRREAVNPTQLEEPKRELNKEIGENKLNARQVGEV